MVEPISSLRNVFGFLRNSIVKAEHETRNKTTSLRTDRGLEYVNSKVKEVLNDMGIRNELTPVENKPANGIAERVN